MAIIIGLVLVAILTLISIVLSLRASRVIPTTLTALELAQEARDVAALALARAEEALQAAKVEADKLYEG